MQLEEESQILTTFATPFGRYKWKRLSFRISSAPEEYQQRMHQVLEGLQGVHVCADDILFCGKGNALEEAEKDHDKNITNIFERF